MRLNGARVKADARLSQDDMVRLPPQGTTSNVRTSEEVRTPDKVRTLDKKTLSLLRRRILLEQEHFFLIDKPAGLSCQGGRGIVQSLDRQLLALAESHPSLGMPRLVHRLDRATSGLLLVAKSRRAAADLATLFQKGKVRKTYCAVLEGTPKKNILTYHSPLVDKRKGEQEATTHLFLLAHNEVYDNSLVLLRPVSGRKHQLRRHLAEAGTPIMGERLYALKKQETFETIKETIVAKPTANPEKTTATTTVTTAQGLMLHALRLVIEEDKYALDIHLPPPDNFFTACLSSRLEAQSLRDSCLDPFA